MNKWEEIDRDIELEVLEKTDTPNKLARLARKSKHREVREKAVQRLNDQHLLMKVVLTSNDDDVKKLAIQRLNDQKLLARIVFSPKCKYCQKQAVERIQDQQLLAKIGMTKWAGFGFLNYIFTDTRLKAIEKLTDSAALKTIIDRELEYISKHPKLNCEDNVKLLAAAFPRLDTATLFGYLEQVQTLAKSTYSGGKVRDAFYAGFKDEEVLLELCGANSEMARLIFELVQKEASVVKLLDRFPEDKYLWLEGTPKIKDPVLFREMAIRSIHPITKESIKKRIKDEAGRFEVALKAAHAGTRLNAASALQDRKLLGQLVAAEQDTVNRRKILAMIDDLTILRQLTSEERLKAEVEERIMDGWNDNRNLVGAALQQSLISVTKVEEKLLAIDNEKARWKAVEELFGKEYHGLKAFQNTLLPDLKVWFFYHCWNTAEELEIVKEIKDNNILQRIIAVGGKLHMADKQNEAVELLTGLIPGDDDQKLAHIAAKAPSVEVREYAISKIQNLELLKEVLQKTKCSLPLILQLTKAASLQEAIDHAGDMELLLQILRHCRQENDLGQAFAKLPRDFDFVTLVCDTSYEHAIRLKALEECHSPDALKQILSQLPVKDVLRIQAAGKFNDPEFISQILPELLQEFGRRDLGQVIRKCSDEALLKQIAKNEIYDIDNRIEAIRLITEPEFLVELALSVGKQSVAEAVMEKIDQKTIEKHWPRILANLNFDVLQSLLTKINLCPECGGKLRLDQWSSTSQVGGPGDSFYRTTEWYETTTTHYSVKCEGCHKILREYEHES